MNELIEKFEDINEDIVQLKEEEYLKYFNQLKNSFETDQNQLNCLLKDFLEEKSSFQTNQTDQINRFLTEKQISLTNHLTMKITHLKQFISSQESLQFHLKSAENDQLNEKSFHENIDHLFGIYQNQLKKINEEFLEMKSPSIEIDEISLEELPAILPDPHQLENQLILFQIRVRTTKSFSKSPLQIEF